MGLFDKAKELAGSAANIASDAAVQKAEEMRQASIEKRQERAAMKQAAKDEARAFGKRIMTVDGEEKGSSITLYEGGIEFSSKDEELKPGKRLFAEINSVAIEDAEELQQRVTVTRLLLVERLPHLRIRHRPGDEEVHRERGGGGARARGLLPQNIWREHELDSGAHG